MISNPIYGKIKNVSNHQPDHKWSNMRWWFMTLFDPQLPSEIAPAPGFNGHPCMHWGHPCSTGCHARIQLFHAAHLQRSSNVALQNAFSARSDMFMLTWNYTWRARRNIFVRSHIFRFFWTCQISSPAITHESFHTSTTCWPNLAM